MFIIINVVVNNADFVGRHVYHFLVGLFVCLFGQGHMVNNITQ